jgi:hypothetical protein
MNRPTVSNIKIIAVTAVNFYEWPFAGRLLRVAECLTLEH